MRRRKSCGYRSSVQSDDANARHLLKVLVERDCVPDIKSLHDNQARAICKTLLLVTIG